MSTISPYTGDGSTTQWDITFDYDDADTVKATVDGVAAPFTFVNSSRIEFDSAPAAGSEIRIYRETPVSPPKVSFEDGAIIRAVDLDEALRQPRDRAEELGSLYSDLDGRAVKVPPGEAGLAVPAQAERANLYPVFDSEGRLTTSAGTGVDAGLRQDLASLSGAERVKLPTGRLLADKVNERPVSVFDGFIPQSEYLLIQLGVSEYDATDDIHAARDAVKGTGQALEFPAGTYLVRNVLWDDEGYAVRTLGRVTFKQTGGLTTLGGGEFSPIWQVSTTGVSFGDANFVGNIGTDFGESSHAVALMSAKNNSFGIVTAQNIRGDVVYSYARSTSDAEMGYGNTFRSVSGTNIYRNRYSGVGGEALVDTMPVSGPYGFRDVHMEPNVEGSYQEPILKFGTAFLGVVEAVSADPNGKSGGLIGDYLDLDLSRVQSSTPAYSEGSSTEPGANSYGLSLGAVRLVSVRYLKLRNYNSNPISLGQGWESLEIGLLDAANCVVTEATYRSLIVQHDTAGAGKIKIGRVVWPDGSGKWLARVQTSGKLNLEILSGDIQGLIGTDLSGSIRLDKVDVDNSSDVLIGSSAGLRVGVGEFSNEGSAIGVYASDDVTWTGTTATFGTAIAGSSSRIKAEYSSINGSPSDGIDFLTGDGAIRQGGVKVVGSQQPFIPSPTGGTTSDAESRAAIDAIRAALSNYGIMAAS